MKSGLSGRTDEDNICEVVPQPIVDEVCEKTRALLQKSDAFTDECIGAVYRLLNANRDKLKPADILEALSDPSESGHEDS